MLLVCVESNEIPLLRKLQQLHAYKCLQWNLPKRTPPNSGRLAYVQQLTEIPRSRSVATSYHDLALRVVLIACICDSCPWNVITVATT